MDERGKSVLEIYKAFSLSELQYTKQVRSWDMQVENREGKKTLVLILSDAPPPDLARKVIARGTLRYKI